jgi:hypothetical protein
MVAIAPCTLSNVNGRWRSSRYQLTQAATSGESLHHDSGRHQDDSMLRSSMKRARLLLSSGGGAPVLDEGGGGNSVFARAFLDELEANTCVLSSPELQTAAHARRSSGSE